MSVILICGGRRLDLSPESNLAQVIQDMRDGKLGEKITDVALLWATMSQDTKDVIANTVLIQKKSITKTAKLYGVDQLLVKKCVLAQDPKWTHTHSKAKMTPELIEKIREAMKTREAKGKTLAEIAKELGVCVPQLYKVSKASILGSSIELKPTQVLEKKVDL